MTRSFLVNRNIIDSTTGSSAQTMEFESFFLLNSQDEINIRPFLALIPSPQSIPSITYFVTRNIEPSADHDEED